MPLDATVSFVHDRPHVRLLHHAHADHIESIYRGLLSLPGNPANVVIQSFGPARTFIAAGNRLENRAVFTGEETTGQIDSVLQHFIDHQSNLVIEVNPANFYVDPPRTWEKRLLKHLLHRGCVIHDMRCVWCRTLPRDRQDSATSHRILRFSSDQMDEYIKLALDVQVGGEWNTERRAGNFQPGWTHYIGFDADAPAAMGSLFISGPSAYLAWWFTHPAHRSRGLQQAGILRRVHDAFDADCTQAFTVTDFNFSSPANLQRCGFQIAYNYLLLRRDPLPLL